MTDFDLDTLRAKILVIFAAAEGEPLRIGYAARRITNEVVVPLLTALAEAEDREQRVRVEQVAAAIPAGSSDPSCPHCGWLLRYGAERHPCIPKSEEA
jgi:hypothetical protein